MLCAVCLLWGTFVAAAAPVVADDLPEAQANAPTAVAVTVYRDNLALITETRTVTLPAGSVRVLFDGVMDRMLPTSAVIDGLGDAVERNFDYDGLSARSLLWRSVGEPVLVTRGPTRGAPARGEHAIIQSVGDGIVLNFADRSEALGCAGLPERLTFERIPTGLRARALLSTTLQRAVAGEHRITLSYLVTGVEWHADYSLTLASDRQHADLAAWITLQNSGEEGLRDAVVGVVAGDLSRVMDEETRADTYRDVTRACWPMGTTQWRGRPIAPGRPAPAAPAPPPAVMAARQIEEVVVTAQRVAAKREALGDYQRYKLPFATDVLAAQSKQVMLLQPRRIALQRLYTFIAGTLPDVQPAPVPTNATLLLRARNDAEHGLDEPLPAGNVNVFVASGAADILFTASGEARDTPTAVDWRVELGESTAVTVLPTLLARSRSKHWFSAATAVRDTLRFEILNATDAEQQIELMQRRIGDSLRNDAPWVMQDGLPTWKLTLGPHDKRSLNYVVSYDQPAASE